MATQFTFKLPDEPGSLATVAEVIGKTGINIDAIAGFSINGQGIITILASNAETAETALKDANVNFSTQDVLLIRLQDKPGQVAMLTRALAEEGINLNTFYVTMTGQQVIGTDNIARTKEIAKDFGIV